MICPLCGGETPPEARFCAKCGSEIADVTQPCATCGSPNPITSKFCRKCGATLATIQEQVEDRVAPEKQETRAETDGITCWRCATLNDRVKRFCRRCGARLIDPVQRLAELGDGLASLRLTLSTKPTHVGERERATLDHLEGLLQASEEALHAGDREKSGQLLSEIERSSSELSAGVARLEEFDREAEQAERARAAIAAIIEEGRTSLASLTYANTSRLEKAIARLETRLASGTNALEQNHFQRSCALLTGTSAEKDLEAVRNALAIALGEQQEMEELARQLQSQLADLQARKDRADQDLSDEAVESPALARKLQLVNTQLLTAQGMLDQGVLKRASQLAESAEANLKTVEQVRLSRAKQREDKQAVETRLVEESGALRESLLILRENLESFTHLSADRQLKVLSDLEQKLHALSSAGPRDTEAKLKAIRQQVQKLREELPELYRGDMRIRNLLGRAARLRQEYGTLHEIVSGLETSEWPSQAALIDHNLGLLDQAIATPRWENPQQLEDLLSNKVTDPSEVAQEVRTHLATEERLSQALARMQAKADALAQDMREAKQEGVGLGDEAEVLSHIGATLGRAQELKAQGKLHEASDALQAIREEELDELRARIEDKLSSAKLVQRKTTLSLSRMPESGGVANYNVILNVSGTGWQDASSIQGSIKVARSDRLDMRKAIDDVTTVINLLFGAQATLRGRSIELPDTEAVDSLSELGDLMYRLFLPTTIQQHLSAAHDPLLIASNDLELPWELMCAENEFVCLRCPVGRMPMMREFPRRNEYTRGERLRFLFIANPTGDLPATEKEVNRIAHRLSEATADVDIWLGDEATGLKLHRALASGNYDIIHFSGHAYFNAENPDESGLLLAGQNVFIAQTIQRTLRGRPLILLNACESGREMMQEGEVSYIASETEGLASSFIRGGALGIVGTLWPIFDEGAAQFAAVFYDHLLSGKTLGEALRLARLQLKESRPNDVTWASFVLYGDPTLTMLE
jgi:ribosomal protein L40E